MSKTVTRTALDSLERCFNRHLVGMDMDEGFDAGEWSGPAHWREFQHDADQLARRFGFDGVSDLRDTADRFGLLTYERHSILCEAEVAL